MAKCPFVLRKLEKLSFAAAARGDVEVVLTSHHQMMPLAAAHAPVVGGVVWRVVVIDEVHEYKNPKTKMAEAAMNAMYKRRSDQQTTLE